MIDVTRTGYETKAIEQSFAKRPGPAPPYKKWSGCIIDIKVIINITLISMVVFPSNGVRAGGAAPEEGTGGGPPSRPARGHGGAL